MQPVRTPVRYIAMALVAIGAGISPAIADESQRPFSAPHQLAVTPIPLEPGPDLMAAGKNNDAIGEPLSTASLENLRGGDSTTTNTVDVSGRVDRNSATNVVSGNNIIQDGSFANASGISTVIQNSGNNVLIQNGTVVNVQFVDPTP
jgi:hypothetical protein